MRQVKKMINNLPLGISSLLYLTLGGMGLVAVYLFQDYLDVYSIVQGEAPQRLHYKVEYAESINPWAFSINKACRYILNDLFAISIIYGLFGESRYVRFAIYVLLAGLFLLVPLYIFLYLAQPQGFSSMLSHLHRIVMNPVLMMLMIPALYFQKRVRQEEG